MCKRLSNLKVKNTTTTPNKKIKAPGSISMTLGTTTSYFFNFIHSFIEEIKNNEELKEMEYLIINNARIHKHEGISILASNNGLRLIYLPLYSSALNAIEEVWSICKSKVKTMKLTVFSNSTCQVRKVCS